jgi:hypothetical protein
MTTAVLRRGQITPPLGQSVMTPTVLREVLSSTLASLTRLGQRPPSLPRP